MNKPLFIILGFLAFTISTTSIDTYTQNVLVNLHNIERSCLGLKNLTWDATIAATAQDWAEYLAVNDEFKHSGEDVGENIATASPRNNLVAFMFSLWASEKEHFSNAKPYPDVSTDGHVVGHYTQLIWGTTTSVGCGIANTSSMSYLVCQYLPAGNYKRSYVYTASDIVSTPNCNPGASQTTTKTPTSSLSSSSTKTTTTTKVTTTSSSPGHSTTYTNTTVTVTPGHSTSSTNTTVLINPVHNTTITVVPSNTTNSTTEDSSATCDTQSPPKSCMDPVIPTNATSNSTQATYPSKPNRPRRGKGKKGKKRVLKIVVDMTKEFGDVEILLRI